MSERRPRTTAFVAACLLAAFAGVPAVAQQGAPPPAVLVQPAEQTPIADQAEFIGRAAAVDKVELRARVKGFLGPRKFNDGDMVKKDQVVFTIEPETYQATVDQKKAQRDAAQAALTNAELQLRRASELLRTQTGTQAVFDQRTSEQLQAKAQPRGCQRPAARRRDPALLHRDQVADRRPHRPRRGVARQHRQPRLGRAGDGGERDADPRAVPGDAARTAGRQARRQHRRSADPAAEAGRRQPLQGKGQDRLHRRHGRSQDRRPDRARDLRQQGRAC